MALWFLTLHLVSAVDRWADQFPNHHLDLDLGLRHQWNTQRMYLSNIGTTFESGAFFVMVNHNVKLKYADQSPYQGLHLHVRWVL